MVLMSVLTVTALQCCSDSGVSLGFGRGLSSVLKAFITIPWFVSVHAQLGASPECVRFTHGIRGPLLHSLPPEIYPLGRSLAPGMVFPNPLARKSMFLSTFSSCAVTQLCTARMPALQSR